MLRIDRTARAEVRRSPAACLALLAAVDDYPRWASLITSADVIEREPGGAPRRVRLRAELLRLGVEMECALEVGGDYAVLRRLPYDERDDERYEAVWSLEPRDPGTSVELHVTAALDAPGPASLLRGRVERMLADDLLADFARAAGELR